MQVRERLFDPYFHQWLRDTEELLEKLPQGLGAPEQSPALPLTFERWLLQLKVCSARAHNTHYPSVKPHGMPMVLYGSVLYLDRNSCLRHSPRRTKLSHADVTLLEAYAGAPAAASLWLPQRRPVLREHTCGGAGKLCTLSALGLIGLFSDCHAMKQGER